MTDSHGQAFAARYCQAHGCTREQFQQRLFWRALYPHAIPAAAVLRVIYPKFFKNDFETIRQIGNCKSLSEARQEIDFLASLTRQERRFLKRALRIRVSGRRLVAILSKL